MLRCITQHNNGQGIIDHSISRRKNLQCPRKKSCSAWKKNLAVPENFIPPPEEKKSSSKLGRKTNPRDRRNLSLLLTVTCRGGTRREGKGARGSCPDQGPNLWRNPRDPSSPWRRLRIRLLPLLATIYSSSKETVAVLLSLYCKPFHFLLLHFAVHVIFFVAVVIVVFFFLFFFFPFFLSLLVVVFCILFFLGLLQQPCSSSSSFWASASPPPPPPCAAALTVLVPVQQQHCRIVRLCVAAAAAAQCVFIQVCFLCFLLLEEWMPKPNNKSNSS